MREGNCSICLTSIDIDTAPVLVMGAYGNPRCLCDSCAEHVENFTRGRDYDSITASMDEISARLSKANIDDGLTVGTITNMLVTSAKRATAIKEGNYDFSLDVEEEEYIIPDELKESEEDRALDEKEELARKKFDKVMNWVWAAVAIATLAFILWKFVI